MGTQKGADRMAMSWIARPTLAEDTTIVISCIDRQPTLVAEADNSSLKAAKLVRQKKPNQARHL